MLVGAQSDCSGSIVLKNSAPMPRSKERSVTRLSKTVHMLQSSLGWSVDTSENEPEMLLPDFFNTIGR
jgi:hypothetical protein